ncbi:carph-isopro domain-containing protein [Sphingobium yanoikuyae]|uniref:carph-isopro domain-containing protein n=1 Tax=Sphingobium yanoikuyae TaxID=13690 RepID=UPI0028A8C0E0|nr:hypothetical protein [Sphingobium yanoikuyae]
MELPYVRRMESEPTLFELFKGIRPMARAIEEHPATVSTWKRVGRIPAEKQPHVLAVGQRLGLPITAEHVVFPLGREAASVLTDLAASPVAVACDPKAGLQRKDIP